VIVELTREGGVEVEPDEHAAGCLLVGAEGSGAKPVRIEVQAPSKFSRSPAGMGVCILDEPVAGTDEG